MFELLDILESKLSHDIYTSINRLSFSYAVADTLGCFIHDGDTVA